jgi:hypothetical protein
MALAMLGLVAALWGGLVRLGWPIPLPRPVVAASHGALMVGGFLGTLIGLERAVALRARWAYVGPALTGVGVLALVLGGPAVPAALPVTLGSLVLVVVSGVLLGRQPALFTATMAGGAAAWLAGNVLWLAGWPVHRLVPWWAGFLVLTIAGERLELTRLLRRSSASHGAFLVAVGLVAAGLVASAIALDPGVRLLGAGLVALAAWLGRHDIARRTVRQRGVTRFIALCLLSGYAWLAASGGLACWVGGVAAGPRYDAWLHALFLGFVFAMILGHAPVVFPAVLGLPMAFRPTFYVPLVVLNATLLARVAGDLGAWPSVRLWGGLGNAAALGLFLANTAHAVVSARAAPDRAG